MKKTILTLIGILLILTTMVVGCATQTPTTSEPPSVAEGPITGVNPDNGTVTIQNEQGGTTTFPILPTTQITLEGQACSLNDLEQEVESGQQFDCNVVYGEGGDVLALDVSRRPEPGSVTGTIGDVNIKDSTVTVQTSEGPKVYQVNPATGLLVGGVACSLDLAGALYLAGAPMDCTVIYEVDNQGKATYIDI
ncbi:MAG: hypothetical protein PHN78_07515, partial [Dehalococcoidales bacterium]|nr:hypothetical protein [Dehalococcoidales bacterium]